MWVERRPVDDEYAEDGRLALLLGRRVVVLNELASLLLETLGDGPLPVPALAEAAVATFGPPENGDPVAAVRAVVRELEDLGLATCSALAPES